MTAASTLRCGACLVNHREDGAFSLETAGPGQADSGLRISGPQKNVKKFKETLLYLLTRAGGKPNVGETVLCKLLYFIDFDHYEKYEERLVGADVV